MYKKSVFYAIAFSLALSSMFPTIAMAAQQHHDPTVAIKASAHPEEMQQKQEDSNSITNRIQNILQPKSVTVTNVEKGHLYIPKDTVIELELTQPISSRKSKKNSSFVLKTVDNLIVNGVIVIPKDQEVRGKVLDSHGNGMFGRGGRLVIDIPSIETINNVDVPLNGYINGYGSDDAGAVAVTAVVSIVGGFFMRGQNIYYEPGQLFQVTVKKDTDLMVTPENLAEEMSPKKSHGQTLTIQAAQ